MHPSYGTPVPRCPVCGRPVGGPGPAPCPSCGLPAVAQAAHVVGRIDATLTELARDRDALVATLRASAAGPAPWAAPAPPPGTSLSPGTAVPPGSALPSGTALPPGTAVPPGSVLPPGTALPPGAHPQPGPPRRLSPQQVLLGLGALLVVAGAVAFVALAWSRLGLAFQASVMAAATAATCAASAAAARRRLRATEEALAAAGAALLAVDLGTAWARDLFGVGALPLRWWAAAACAAVAGLAVVLGRLTRSTATWPLTALLAAQPVPFLLLGAERIDGPAGVTVALAVAGADVLTAGRLRRPLAPVAGVLAVVWSATAAIGGLGVAGTDEPARAWVVVAVLAGGAVFSLLLLRAPGAARRVATSPVALGAAAVATGTGRSTGHRLPVAAVVADLVLAAWAGAAAAHLTATEAWTLPAAAGLLLVALPRLRAGAPSWTAEGAAVAVALVPSALDAATDPHPVRLALVVAGAVAATVGGALRHRQAPFVLGAGSLAFVALSRLGPYAPLLPRWIVLSTAGLVLLAVGATYERRRQQAREAVAWVAQLR